MTSAAACQVIKHIVGQSIFQLAVMYGLVFYGDDLFGVANADTIQGASQHYTLVFNAFVLMQLFNQVSAARFGHSMDPMSASLVHSLHDSAAGRCRKTHFETSITTLKWLICCCWYLEIECGTYACVN